jgi:hypothetical protein
MATVACDRTNTTVEQMICSSQVLSDMDDELAAILDAPVLRHIRIRPPEDERGEPQDHQTVHRHESATVWPDASMRLKGQ